MTAVSIRTALLFPQSRRKLHMRKVIDVFVPLLLLTTDIKFCNVIDSEIAECRLLVHKD
jgi:hypothetical protein